MDCRPLPRICACASALVLAAGLAGCGGSSPRQSTATRAEASSPSAAVLATPTQAGHGLERFGAPGMQLHFLYPSAFAAVKPAAPKQVAGASGASRVLYAEVALDAQDALYVVERTSSPLHVTEASAPKLAPALTREIDALTGHQLQASIYVVHGDVVMEWPRVTQPGLASGGTDQYSEIFAGGAEYELQCIATKANRARVQAACTEAMSTVIVSAH